VAGGKLFFLAIGPEGFELRVSNGTPAGTSLVREIAPGPASYVIKDVTAVGNEVFFLASDDGLSLKLWKSDGTAGGTQALKTVPDHAGSLTVAGGRLFFTADCQLWKSDGTPDGTGVVTEIQTAPGVCFPLYPLSQQGGKLLFFASDGVHGLEPWTSDGTAAGTTLLADLNPGIGSSRFFLGDVFAGGRWYFRVERGEHTGVQLWTSDGTPAGTRALPINRQRSAFRVSNQGTLVGPRALFDMNGTLLFQGGNGATGAELGRSDGTDAGTRVVKDLKPGPASSLPGEFTRAGGTVFFRSGAGTGTEKLWKTDGTEQGTQVLYAPEHLHFGGLFSPRDLTALGQQLLFAGSYWDDFSESLLKTDGTPEGTVPVSSSPEIFDVNSLLSLKDHLVLFQSHKELWKSDGTEAGTAPLASAPPLDRARPLAGFSAARDGVLFFAASTPQTGEELWRSDGTEAGTFLLTELVPGVGWKPLGPFAVAGPAVFFAAGGIELWKNEGGRTSLVRRLPPGDPAFGIRSMTKLGNRVYFTYHDHARGHELWVSDGTEAGTRIVKDLLPGPGSSHPRQLRAVGGTLLFSASDGVHGFEPWRSDGTRRGTAMIQDIAPGALSSSPVEFTASGPYVYFAANDGKTGFELWAIPRPPS
jgi:ELWxxDGT repeat protein